MKLFFHSLSPKRVFESLGSGLGESRLGGSSGGVDIFGVGFVDIIFGVGNYTNRRGWATGRSRIRRGGRRGDLI